MAIMITKYVHNPFTHETVTVYVKRLTISKVPIFNTARTIAAARIALTVQIHNVRPNLSAVLLAHHLASVNKPIRSGTSKFLIHNNIHSFPPFIFNLGQCPHTRPRQAVGGLKTLSQIVQVIVPPRDMRAHKLASLRVSKVKHD